MSVSPRLSLSFFGGFHAYRSDHPVAGIGYDKMRALLAYLAMERDQTHTRETLAELLWQDSPQERGRGNLRRTLADLRRVLHQPGQPPPFEATRKTVRFVADCPVDALQFAQAPDKCIATPACYRCEACISHMEEATSLYRGEFLAGLSLPDCPEFEDWLTIQRESLLLRALALLEQLAGHHERAGNYAQAIAYARRQVELDSWQESGHRRLMRLLALNGQPGAALAQFELCRNLLQKELGVQPNEETLALFRAIGSSESCQAAAMAAPAPAIHVPPSVRRQVTVVYCELAIPDADDPEEAMYRLHEPQVRCGDILRAHGGHVVQSHGGGLLAYFGYPEAREDAARQAVQAALALTSVAAPALVRCGIHTGLIVTTPEQTIPDVAGQTSNRAIQLRLAAEPGQIAISENSCRLVAGYFRCRELPGPADGYLIDAATGASHRLEAAASVSPLVGRKRELERLLEQWKSAIAGQGAVALLRGEAGIGKSRLVLEMKKRLPAENRKAVRECRCLPHDAATPFHPFTHWLAQTCGFLNGEADSDKRLKLDRFLREQAMADDDAIELVATLFGLPTNVPSSIPYLARIQQRKRLLQALAEALLMPGAQPQVLVIEDLHWADSSTLELISALAESIADRPVLLLLTARVEFEAAGWTDSIIELDRLAEEYADELAAKLIPDLPESKVRRIVELSEGVPLFIEELVQWSVLTGAGPATMTVPLTLQDLLMARIDQHSTAIRPAQVAAAIGKEFDRSMLAAVLEERGEALEPHLGPLLQSGLVALGEGERIQFKHALIQEAAYQSQPRSLRAQTHRHIATVLQRDYAETCLRTPAILAHHLTEAGETQSAIEYWQNAGRSAARYASDREAALHYRQALCLLDTLPPSPSRDHAELSLQLALGTSLNAVLGYAADDTRRAYARAQELTRQSGGTDEQFRTLYGMWTSLPDHAQATEVTGLLIDIAQSSRQPIHLVMACYADMTVRFFMSPFHESRARAERIISLCRDIDTRACIATYGENPLSSALALLSFALWFAGHADQACAASENALREARRTGFSHGLCVALAFAGHLHRRLRLPQQVEALGLELKQLARQHNLGIWSHSADTLIGWARVAQGDADGLDACLNGLNGIRRTLPMLEVSYTTILLEAYAELDRHHDRLREAEAALDKATRNHDQYLLPELLRHKAEAMLAISPLAAEAASVLLRQALSLASAYGSKALALRAATSLARMEITQDTAAILAQAVAAIDEGHATADHRDALELLNQPPRMN